MKWDLILLGQGSSLYKAKTQRSFPEIRSMHSWTTEGKELVKLDLTRHRSLRSASTSDTLRSTDEEDTGFSSPDKPRTGKDSVGSAVGSDYGSSGSESPDGLGTFRLNGVVAQNSLSRLKEEVSF